MSEVMHKTIGIQKIQDAYDQLEAILAPLSAEQMTTPHVNGSWSIKDNLAHLTGWLVYLLLQLQGIMDGQKPSDWMAGLSSEDEINEALYQQSKDRSLSEVLAEFRATHQRVLTTLTALSEAELNAPFPWSQSGKPAFELVAGNTFGHYEEHSAIIQRWLQQQ